MSGGGSEKVDQGNSSCSVCDHRLCVGERRQTRAHRRILRELRDIQNRKREVAGLPPEEGTGLSGTVQEGSGVSVNLEYGPREK